MNVRVDLLGEAEAAGRGPNGDPMSRLQASAAVKRSARPILLASALALGCGVPSAAATTGDSGYVYGPAFRGLQLAIVVNFENPGFFRSRISIPVTVRVKNVGQKAIGFGLGASPEAPEAVAADCYRQSRVRKVWALLPTGPDRNVYSIGKPPPQLATGATLQTNLELACWADLKRGATYSVRFLDQRI